MSIKELIFIVIVGLALSLVITRTDLGSHFHQEKESTYIVPNGTRDLKIFCATLGLLLVFIFIIIYLAQSNTTSAIAEEGKHTRGTVVSQATKTRQYVKQEGGRYAHEVEAHVDTDTRAQEDATMKDFSAQKRYIQKKDEEISRQISTLEKKIMKDQKAGQATEAAQQRLTQVITLQKRASALELKAEQLQKEEGYVDLGPVEFIKQAQKEIDFLKHAYNGRYSGGKTGDVFDDTGGLAESNPHDLIGGDSPVTPQNAIALYQENSKHHGLGWYVVAPVGLETKPVELIQMVEAQIAAWYTKWSTQFNQKVDKLNMEAKRFLEEYHNLIQAYNEIYSSTLPTSVSSPDLTSTSTLLEHVKDLALRSCKMVLAALPTAVKVSLGSSLEGILEDGKPIHSLSCLVEVDINQAKAPEKSGSYSIGAPAITPTLCPNLPPGFLQSMPKSAYQSFCERYNALPREIKITGLGTVHVPTTSDNTVETIGNFISDNSITGFDKIQLSYVDSKVFTIQSTTVSDTTEGQLRGHKVEYLDISLEKGPSDSLYTLAPPTSHRAVLVIISLENNYSGLVDYFHKQDRTDQAGKSLKALMIEYVKERKSQFNTLYTPVTPS